ncbi:MAG: hypothetical protein KAS94_13125, partial [Desulfobulbaceae bacterium]|nr:hypothetical protein [Desulfobulbaceae bacterium]
QRHYNRIGTPSVRVSESGKKDIYVDTDRASIYSMTQEFETSTGRYTNLIYRVHFPLTPLPHLTAGKNVGLLIYITLNSQNEEILITTLHTCGCFLAFIPTTTLPERSWPTGWQKTGQIVYGEELASLIESQNSRQRLIIKLRSETHRVMNIKYANTTAYGNITSQPMHMEPMSALAKLPAENNQSVSFFATEGIRKGIVKGSRKPLEMLFMGWLAMDPFIGEDKALGPPDETGVKLYTSLKFWARNNSNIWFFPRFLQYWGWDL